jgi:hypothetical protein
MIEQWRKERTSLDNQMGAIRHHIESHPNRDMYQGSRAKLRFLLNQLALKRQSVHHQIRKYEEDERMSEIFRNISGLTEAETASLMKEMERLKMVHV